MKHEQVERLIELAKDEPGLAELLASLPAPPQSAEDRPMWKLVEDLAAIAAGLGEGVYASRLRSITRELARGLGRLGVDVGDDDFPF